MSPSLKHPRIALGRPATWEDLDLVPEGYLGEIVDGNIVVSPRPDAPHMEVSSDLGVLLGNPFRFGVGGPGGWVIRDEPRVRFDARTIRVPDLAGWRQERYAAPRRGPLTVVPDWICEILSPGTTRRDRAEKMPLYAAHGVRHLWIIDPVLQILEVYRLRDGAWTSVATHVADAKVRVEPFDAVELDLTQVWGPKTEIEEEPEE